MCKKDDKYLCYYYFVSTRTKGGKQKKKEYLFVLSIAVCFEAFRGVQLDGGAADHLDAALLVLHTQRSHTAVHLNKKYEEDVCVRLLLLVHCVFGGKQLTELNVNYNL